MVSEVDGLTCEWCGRTFARPHQRGPAPKFCRPAHRQAAYRVRLDGRPGLQDRATGWHLVRYPDARQTDVIAKLTEEVGKLARATIGEIEGRPDRGDPVLEAAQVVLVVLSFVGRFYPHADLLAAVDAELCRHGA